MIDPARKQVGFFHSASHEIEIRELPPARRPETVMDHMTAEARHVLPTWRKGEANAAHQRTPRPWPGSGATDLLRSSVAQPLQGIDFINRNGLHEHLSGLMRIPQRDVDRMAPLYWQVQKVPETLSILLDMSRNRFRKGLVHERAKHKS